MPPLPHRSPWLFYAIFRAAGYAVIPAAGCAVFRAAGYAVFRAAGYAVFFAAGCAACGCQGASDLERVAVGGTVTRSGAPLASGVISFRPAEGRSGPAATANIHAGRYQFDSRDGPTSGPHQVVILSTVEGTRKSPFPAPPTAEAPPSADRPAPWTFEIDVSAKAPSEIPFELP